jgi:hypothetical protein
MRSAYIAAIVGMIWMLPGAQAQEYRQGDLVITHPWARPTSGDTHLGAAYLTIKNMGQAADTLQSVSTSVAAKSEIHEHIHNSGGVMRMRPLEGGLAVPPGSTVELKPGGNHIMLMGLQHNLEEGKSVPLKLTFAHAGEIEVEVHVEKSPGHGSSDGMGAEAHMHH